ncbi:MAG: Crp/Fnr family transcriptional regulator [Cyanobacteria bacterium P01_A01_bin.83]
MRLSDPDSLPSRLRRKITYRNLAVGERLFRIGDSAESFFIVDQGRISLSRPTIENKKAVLQFAKLGDIIGENAIFEAAYTYSAIAIDDSRVIVYPQNFITEILHTHPELIADLLRLTHQKITYFQNSLELREIRAAHQRVLQFLIYAADANKAVKLDLSLHNVARQLGFAPATLSRALLKLETDGSITRERESNVIYLNSSTAA